MEEKDVEEENRKKEREKENNFLIGKRIKDTFAMVNK
jgi:hypothetical protein